MAMSACAAVGVVLYSPYRSILAGRKMAKKGEKTTVLQQGKRGRPRSSDKRTRKVTLSFTDAEWQQFREISEAFDMRMAAMMREFLVEIIPTLSEMAEMARVAKNAQNVAKEAVLSTLQNAYADSVKTAELEKQRLNNIVSEFVSMVSKPVNDSPYAPPSTNRGVRSDSDSADAASKRGEK
jgi:hypothetical protein